MITNTTELLSKKQTYENSCGACCLLVAAKELGITEMPNLRDSKVGIIGGRLELTNICEDEIYLITSRSTCHRDMQPQLDKAGYSMPQGIIMAARLLGLKPKFTKNNSFISRALPFVYSKVENECKGIGCPVELESPDDANYYRLRVLTVSVPPLPRVGLHWVLSRPDGSYMDPGIGKNAASFEELKDNVKKENSRFASCIDAGISIVLRTIDSDSDTE